MASMEQLKELFAATTSVDNKTRRQAEDALFEAAKQPSYVQIVLQLISTPSGPQDMVIQQAAAVHFRNVIKKAWVPPENLDEDQEDLSNGIRLDANVRAMIKEHLVQLMVTTPPSIQAQLSSAISIIAETDYHQNWQSLLPSLVAQLDGTDLHTIMGVLKTANAIFKMFRDVPKSDPLFAVIVYTLNGIAYPLTKLMQQLGAQVASPQVMQNERALEEHLEAIRLICRIVYSLNWQDLPECFEDNMGVWMTEFNKYMQVGIFTILENEDEPSVLDKLQVAIVEIWGIWADKDEDVFVEKYLTGCTKLVWDRLVSLTSSSKDDVLATKSMKFLSNLVIKQMYAHIFKPELERMVEKIVIPNLTFREDVDEGRFEENPFDYILTEIEGSDMESRRRCAQDLLTSMNRNMEQETSVICLRWVQNLLQLSASNPSQWAAKDAAIHLFINIAIRRENLSGVVEINSHANVYEFFTSQILPELRDGNCDDRPVVKVAAIKFMSTFRKQFSREHYIELLPYLIAHLSSASIVVHSFAAYTIERMLVTRDETNTPKIEGPQLQPFLQPLFHSLFALVDDAALEENTYVMKCIMRSLWTGRDHVAAVAEHVTSRLTASMQRVSKDVRKPDYNHYLFESLAVLVKAVCRAGPQNAVAFEEVLKDPFTYILSQEIVEFTPYVFQILAQLLEYRPKEAGLSDFSVNLFTMIKNPINWEKRGDIPALSRLVKAYIEQAPKELESSLSPVLGIFQKLMTIKATEKQGMTILNAIIATYDLSSVRPFLKEIFSILLTRLVKVRTEKFLRLVASFVGLVVAKYGSDTLCEILNQLGNGLVEQVVGMFWAEPLYKNPPVQATEAKHQVIGVTRFLFEERSTNILDTDQLAWMKLVLSVVKILSSNTFANSAKVAGLDNEDVVEVQYDSQFAELVFSRAVAVDPFPENTTFKRDFFQGLARLSQSRPGQIGPLLQQADEKTRAQLGVLLHDQGVQL